jgi:hypothetical protein
MIAIGMISISKYYKVLIFVIITFNFVHFSVSRGFVSAGGISEAFKIAGDKGRLVLFEYA